MRTHGGGEADSPVQQEGNARSNADVMLFDSAVLLDGRGGDRSAAGDGLVAHAGLALAVGCLQHSARAVCPHVTGTW